MPLLQRLTLWLFSPPPEPRTTSSVIAWWEKRRLFYNVFVGSIGFCSLIAFFFFILHSDALKPGEDAEEPLAILFAPVAVNICYTAGWILETLALKTGVGGKRLRGPLLMRVGLAFSLFVILLPSVLWGIFWAVHVLHR